LSSDRLIATADLAGYRRTKIDGEFVELPSRVHVETFDIKSKLTLEITEVQEEVRTTGIISDQLFDFSHMARRFSNTLPPVILDQDDSWPAFPPDFDWSVYRLEN
jgi:hypothetical protein